MSKPVGPASAAEREAFANRAGQGALGRMSDAGFREIQLDAKQLVWLFMTAAVVLVVAFLLGVMVGRGVKAQQGVTTVAAAAGQPPPGGSEPSTVVGGLPAGQPAAPAPPGEDAFSYYGRLEAPTPPPESMKPGEAPPASPPATAPNARGTAGSVAAPPVAGTSTPGAAGARPQSELTADPPGPGWLVKVVAYQERAQADAVLARLVGKGYAAYVVVLPGKGRPLYGVRVGKFQTRAEADAIRRRLEKEDQFKPLVSR